MLAKGLAWFSVTASVDIRIGLTEYNYKDPGNSLGKRGVEERRATQNSPISPPLCRERGSTEQRQQHECWAHLRSRCVLSCRLRLGFNTSEMNHQKKAESECSIANGQKGLCMSAAALVWEMGVVMGVGEAASHLRPRAGKK